MYGCMKKYSLGVIQEILYVLWINDRVGKFIFVWHTAYWCNAVHEKLDSVVVHRRQSTTARRPCKFTSQKNLWCCQCTEVFYRISDCNTATVPLPTPHLREKVPLLSSEALWKKSISNIYKTARKQLAVRNLGTGSAERKRWNSYTVFYKIGTN